MKARHKWLGIALIATLIAVFWPSSEQTEEEVVAPAARRPAKMPIQTVTQATMGVVKPEATEGSNRMQTAKGNLFPEQTWVPPPPPPKPYVPPPPPPPKPPPLPFKFLGRWVDEGKETVFLVQGETPLPIKTGQLLSGSWRVDEITQAKVVFTYLPLDMQSTLGITP